MQIQNKTSAKSGFQRFQVLVQDPMRHRLTPITHAYNSVTLRNLFRSVSKYCAILLVI
jgi:hypothetical protein